MHAKFHRDGAVTHDVFVAGKGETDTGAGLAAFLRPTDLITHTFYHRASTRVAEMGQTQGDRVDAGPDRQFVDTRLDGKNVDVRAQ
ncbi:hypothetical protein D3C78_1767790 [compost metagenome]